MCSSGILSFTLVLNFTPNNLNQFFCSETNFFSPFDVYISFQNASEFMVVQTTTALASGQFSEKLGSLEAEKSRLSASLNRRTHDYGRLLELSENLTQQLEDKSLSFIQLEKNYHVSTY